MCQTGYRSSPLPKRHRARKSLEGLNSAFAEWVDKKQSSQSPGNFHTCKQCNLQNSRCVVWARCHNCKHVCRRNLETIHAAARSTPWFMSRLKANGSILRVHIRNRAVCVWGLCVTIQRAAGERHWPFSFFFACLPNAPHICHFVLAAAGRVDGPQIVLFNALEASLQLQDQQPWLASQYWKKHRPWLVNAPPLK